MKKFKMEIFDYFRSRDFLIIHEKSINNVSDNHDFNTSLLVAHKQYILEKSYDRLFISQKTFFPSYHDNLLRNPLLSFHHTMANVYFKNPNSINKCLTFSLIIMKDLLLIDLDNLIVVINEDIFNQYKDELVPSLSGLTIWKSIKRNYYSFDYKDQAVTGDYIKFIYKYQNGYLPVYDFVLMTYQDHMIIESGFLVERAYFIKSYQHNIFETNLYSHLINKLVKLWGKDILTPEKDFIGYYFAHMLRSLTLVMLDGLTPSNKSPRAKKLRYWMKYCLIRLSLYNYSHYSVLLVLDEVFESLSLSGYTYKEKNYQSARKNWENEIRLLEKDLFNMFLSDINGEKVQNTTFSQVKNTIHFDNQLALAKNNLLASHAYTFLNESEKMVKLDETALRNVLYVKEVL